MHNNKLMFHRNNIKTYNIVMIIDINKWYDIELKSCKNI